MAVRAVVCASIVFAGCGGSSPPATGVERAASTVGVNFGVTVPRPVNGTVTSADGAIRCGTGGTACTATFPWTATVTLTATPDFGYVFTSWAGDCTLTGPCVLSTAKNGADKTVVAVFSLAGQGGHGGFLAAPKDHGPPYFDFLAKAPGALNCASNLCHGADLAGRGIAPGCFNCHTTAGWTGSWQANCSFCHGARTASTKAGPYDVSAHPTWTAPPDSLSQRLNGTADPARTGAHQAHLTGATALGASLSPPFSCQTCHAVPTDLSHIRGSTARANVALSAAGQANLPATLGTYDPASGTCATYCHGAFSGGSAAAPVWADASGSAAACGTCHGLPPPAPHPQASDCGTCHPGYTNATVNVATHVNGKVDLLGTGCTSCHGDPPAAPHVARTDCATCHGAGYSASTVNAATHQNGTVDLLPLSCTTCHGDETRVAVDGAGVSIAAAPPVGTRLETDTTQPAVGAHQAHLTAGAYARALECIDCHDVPTSTAHATGVVTFDWSLLAKGTGTPTFDPGALTCSSTYCHGNFAGGNAANAPAWTAGSAGAQCGSCHGLPAAPHPQLGACERCHVGYTATAVNLADHVNGTVEYALTCTSCHGAENPAPPIDTHGLTGTTLVSVGAHQAHVAPTLTGTAIACSACHGGAAD
ncbi:MAG TPA: CxxxxCH/CxxCH domain-containing protein, partial [Anaeromyxobacteraceae bacterium]|nr:CxxxxCH/CxxCH domain-containing protein [Anaeromyxobacteraceae bacterium]